MSVGSLIQNRVRINVTSLTEIYDKASNSIGTRANKACLVTFVSDKYAVQDVVWVELIGKLEIYALRQAASQQSSEANSQDMYVLLKKKFTIAIYGSY